MTVGFTGKIMSQIHLQNSIARMNDDEAEAQQLIELACKQIKSDDITHRGFLKPIEIALKTYKTEVLNQNNTLSPESLPAGLKISVRTSLEHDRKVLQDVLEIRPDEGYKELKENNKDNMLALMKKQKGIEIAICVCMYSENKSMLKSTLAGVAENIANLVAYEGINPDDIGVFVLMDGIQKVDRSIIDYVKELEMTSNIYLGENIVQSLTVNELIERSKTKTQEEINTEQMRNINNYLFNVAQLEERNQMRFESIRADYFEKRNLLQNITQLLKKKPLYDDLPMQIQNYFIEEVKKERRIDFNEADEDMKKLSHEELIDPYISDVRRIRPLVTRALRKAETLYSNYLKTRDDLSYLSYFRKKIPYSQDLIKKAFADRVHNYDPADFDDSHKRLSDEFDDMLKTVMNLFLCVKYKNSGKLSSHNWFFNGFCKQLKPKYAVLLDVGLKPEGTALMKMYAYMKKYSHVGGVCGYMSLKIEKKDENDELDSQNVDCLTQITNCFFDIQRTQQVEYHFAHLMDKPFEAAFGFIHVLPGAFSAYNMKAIIDYNAKSDDDLLKSYFRSIDEKIANRKVKESQMTASDVIARTALPDLINGMCINIDPETDQALLYNQNVYLAEDRILCMGIHKKGFDMAFLPDAYAEVDPMKTVHGLLGQRKRWINGSYFAFEKVKRELSEYQYQFGCELCLNIQIFYLSFNNALAYFAPSFFLFTVHIAMDAFRQDVLVKLLSNVITNPTTSEFYNAFVYTMDFFYILLVMAIIFFSLQMTHSNKKFIPYIYITSTLMGIFMVIVLAVLLTDLIRGLISQQNFLVTSQVFIQNIPQGLLLLTILRYMLVGSLALYFIPIFFYVMLFGKGNILCEVLLGYLSFIFYTPTYLNILNIYSLCRIDDISWGTKGLEAGSKKNEDLKGSWRQIKFVHVAKYVLWNILVSAIFLTLGATYTTRFYVTLGMVTLITTSLALKVVIGLTYMLFYKLKKCCFESLSPSLKNHSRISAEISRHTDQIMEQVMDNLNGIKEEYIRNGGMGKSFIGSVFSKRNIENSYNKQKADFKGRSGILKRYSSKKQDPLPPPTSQENNKTDSFNSHWKQIKKEVTWANQKRNNPAESGQDHINPNIVKKEQESSNEHLSSGSGKDSNSRLLIEPLRQTNPHKQPDLPKQPDPIKETGRRPKKTIF